MQRFLRILINVGLAGILIWTSLLVFIYFRLLWDKIVRPQYKNMNDKEVIQFGLLALAFIVVDIFIVRRFIRLVRKSNGR
jgi:hypothetical protein